MKGQKWTTVGVLLAWTLGTAWAVAQDASVQVGVRVVIRPPTVFLTPHAWFPQEPHHAGQRRWAFFITVSLETSQVIETACVSPNPSRFPKSVRMRPGERILVVQMTSSTPAVCEAGNRAIPLIRRAFQRFDKVFTVIPQAPALEAFSYNLVQQVLYGTKAFSPDVRVQVRLITYAQAYTYWMRSHTNR